MFVEASLIDRGSGGLDDLIDGLVVVTCPGELRERRVAARDGMSPEEIPPPHGFPDVRNGKGFSGRFSDKKLL